MRALFEAFDLTRPGLEAARRAFEAGALGEACEALVGYYRDAAAAPTPRPPRLEQSDALAYADGIVEDDVYRGPGDRGPVPRRADGHLDWTHRGPQGDRQFANKLNRHFHLDRLLEAYRATGEAKYAERIDRDLRDWLVASGAEPTPEGFGTSHLEPANRVPAWARVFVGLRNSDSLRPATRLLLLAAIPGHAEHLLAHPGPYNWVTMTQLGALTCGASWPEFAAAARWRERALATLCENAAETVYPDGAQKELTASYHLVALERYEDAADLAERAGEDVPAAFYATIERMWAYVADVMRPSGTTPLNNDADVVPIAGQLRERAASYGRPDWCFVATQGAEGKAPEKPASRFLPWAGQLVSRSGWDAEAHWGFFDAGPWGTAHQHDDSLHLSVSAFGRDLLVDSGRFAYQGEIADRFKDAYAKHTRGHNTILIDGEDQGPGVKEAQEPHELHAVRDGFDFALATAPSQHGARHTRAVLYLRDTGWVVLDHLRGPGRHEAEALWHFHPDAGAAAEGGDVVTTHAGAGHLRLHPLGDAVGEPEIVAGREDPHPQGWYSPVYGQYRASPCAVYSLSFEETTVLGWALVPARNAPAAPAVEWLEAPEGVARLRVRDPDPAPRTITVALDDAALPVNLPDGRRLDGRLLLELDEGEPSVACGVLRSAAGDRSA